MTEALATGPQPITMQTDLGTVDVYEFGTPRPEKFVVAIQGKSSNLDVITEWFATAHTLAAAGWHVALPNLHSNELTKPGVIGSADVQKIILGLYSKHGVQLAVVMGKSWGGGQAVEFAASHPEMVTRLVLVAPALADMTLIERIARIPTALFWARDDPVKSYDLAKQYADGMEQCQLLSINDGGHRIVAEYVPSIQAFVVSAEGGSGGSGSVGVAGGGSGGGGDGSGSGGDCSVAAPVAEPQQLALPAPGDEGGGAITLDCSTGEAVKLDHLGPVVVNSDGTLSRIANWSEMTEKEQQLTKRRVAKRNVERLRSFQGEVGEVGAPVVSALADAAPDARSA